MSSIPASVPLRAYSSVRSPHQSSRAPPSAHGVTKHGSLDPARPLTSGSDFLLQRWGPPPVWPPVDLPGSVAAPGLCGPQWLFLCGGHKHPYQVATSSSLNMGFRSLSPQMMKQRLNILAPGLKPVSFPVNNLDKHTSLSQWLPRDFLSNLVF